jgi:3'-5' exoribonuclease
VSKPENPTVGLGDVRRIVDSIENNSIKHFMQFVLGPDGVLDEFMKSPGSRSKHHAWPGGLAYHTVHAAKLGRDIADSYIARGIELDRDLIIAGILLHDIGKIGTYLEDGVDEKGRVKFKHNPRALLHHHIPLGYALISELIKKYNSKGAPYGCELSDEQIDKLLHIILSHHGRKAWSSPVTPQFVEAYVVHVVEMMDGYIDMFVGGEIPQDFYDH